VPADLGFLSHRDPIVPPRRVSATRQQERGHIRMEGLASLHVPVMLNIDGVTQQRPPVAAIVFDVPAGIKKLTQAWQILVLDRVMRRRLHPRPHTERTRKRRRPLAKREESSWG
jgi:hypothetical protein